MDDSIAKMVRDVLDDPECRFEKQQLHTSQKQLQALPKDLVDKIAKVAADSSQKVGSEHVLTAMREISKKVKSDSGKENSRLGKVELEKLVQSIQQAGRKVEQRLQYCYIGKTQYEPYKDDEKVRDFVDRFSVSDVTVEEAVGPNNVICEYPGWFPSRGWAIYTISQLRTIYEETASKANDTPSDPFERILAKPSLSLEEDVPLAPILDDPNTGGASSSSCRPKAKVNLTKTNTNTKKAGVKTAKPNQKKFGVGSLFGDFGWKSGAIEEVKNLASTDGFAGMKVALTLTAVPVAGLSELGEPKCIDLGSAVVDVARINAMIDSIKTKDAEKGKETEEKTEGSASEEKDEKKENPGDSKNQQEESEKEDLGGPKGEQNEPVKQDSNDSKGEQKESEKRDSSDSKGEQKETAPTKMDEPKGEQVDEDPFGEFDAQMLGDWDGLRTGETDSESEESSDLGTKRRRTDGESEKTVDAPVDDLLAGP